MVLKSYLGIGNRMIFCSPNSTQDVEPFSNSAYKMSQVAPIDPNKALCIFLSKDALMCGTANYYMM